MNLLLNPMGKQILIIEDQKELADLISSSLLKIGLTSKKIGEGLKGEKEALTGQYLLIILDIILPGKSGIEILKQLRTSNVLTPVIVLTTRTTAQSVVEGFHLGADDYVPKPFRMQELIARVEAMLRRTKGNYSNKIMYRDLVVDLETKHVKKDGKEIKLSNTMYKILALILRNKGKIVKREEIITQVWDGKESPTPGTVDVHINSIRNLLDGDEREKYLKTIHGVGYIAER